MKRLRVIACRAFGRIVGQTTSVFAVMAFLAVSGAFFAKSLFDAEGTAVSVPSVWAGAMATALPLLTSLLTMRLWDGNGEPDGVAIDLVAPVPERQFAIGRFLGAYCAVVATVVVSLVVPVFVLPYCAPALAAKLSIIRMLPALAALCVYALPLTALGSLSGVAFRRSVPAATASILLTGVVPQAVYRACVEWSPMVRKRFAEMPLDALVADAADGAVSTGAIACAVAISAFALFAASKAFAMRRFVGGGKVALKASTVVAVASALLATVLFGVLAHRLDVKVVWPGGFRETVFSARAREILSDISHEVRITACLRRNSPEFIPVARLLRSVSDESRTVAGAGVVCEFIDPRWDLASARLAHLGLGEGAVMFASDRRRIVVSAKELDEGVCASAIQRLSMPMKCERILFTSGHGEPSIDDFGSEGASDAARALRRDGYRVESLFTATSSIPADCSVLVVSGARMPFSAAEMRNVEIFLAQGGHLLATASHDEVAGLGSLLESHGISVECAVAKSGTTGGSDIVATGFGDHAVSAQLTGTAVVFAPGTVRFKIADPVHGHENDFSFSPLCMADDDILAVAAEKGASLKSDLAIRPARIVLIGDNSFLRNASLSSRANANGDLLLNSMAWLAGLDVSGSANIAGNVVAAHMDRDGRIRFTLAAVCFIPVSVAVIGLLVVVWKRRHA